MPKDSGRGPSLWSTVLTDLRARLAAGEFVDRFPSDRELMAHYGVSRHTVREAVRHLEGIERRPRVGGRVTTPPTVLRRLLDTLTALGVRTSTSVPTTNEHRAAEIAARLDRDPRTPLTVHAGVLLADGLPLIYLENWSGTADSVRTELVGLLLAESAQESGLLDVVAQTTVPTVPEPPVCAALNIPVGSATFCIEARLETPEGAPIWQRAFIRPDRYPCILQFTTT